MKALALDLTPTLATVLLVPCWLARWFGAETKVVELERAPIHPDRSAHQTTLEWRTVATHRWLHQLDRELYCLIRDALDFRPRPALPAAVARAWLAPGGGE